ncbi:cobalamin-dependent protein [Aliifodinibius salicampi]|uniref:Cobalamin-dependent protein n=1 Tax=Fodinibius salicampi TaxID=1920655 RepID=A0ABT3PU44_9BACT|nr:cobalamin-dependent protein [Fodinibius salicampi]MCW9711378.1 cobalamin-dependent protein [Fodinibius salicampi]
MSDSNSSVVQSLEEHKQALAQIMTDLYFKNHPELVEEYGEKAKEKCYEDAIYHINYLGQAIRVDSQKIFNSYLDWARTMLKERGEDVNDLIDNIKFLKKAIYQRIPRDEASELTLYIDRGLAVLQNEEVKEQSFFQSGDPLVEEAQTYLDFLLSGKRTEAGEYIDKLVKEGVAIKDIYEHIFQKSQYEVGALWQSNIISVAHEHYCTAATQLIMSQLYPKIFSTKKKGYKLVACSVADELHEIGIRMVADFFEMEGWDTYYMGANMPAHNLVSAIKEYEADVLAVSVTMPLHLDKAGKLIKTIRSDSEINDLKILVGGYPFRIEPELWKKLGADGSATSAKEAIKLATKLSTQKS